MSKYFVGGRWFAGYRCNGYNRGTLLEILEVLGYGRKKKLRVRDIDGNTSVVSFKTLWKKCKVS